MWLRGGARPSCARLAALRFVCFGGQRVADGSRAVVKSAVPRRCDPSTCDRALPRSRVASSQLVHPILRASFALDPPPLPFTPYSPIAAGGSMFALWHRSDSAVSYCGIFFRSRVLGCTVLTSVLCCAYQMCWCHRVETKISVRSLRQSCARTSVCCVAVVVHTDTVH